MKFFLTIPKRKPSMRFHLWPNDANSQCEEMLVISPPVLSSNLTRPDHPPPFKTRFIVLDFVRWPWVTVGASTNLDVMQTTSIPKA